MKIYKFPQSTLLIEYKDKRILFDPGCFCSEQDDFGKVDLLLITHKHGDHLDINVIRKIQKANPEIITLSNQQVVDVLVEAGLKCELLKVDEVRKIDEDVNAISVKGIKQLHGEAGKGYDKFENLGFLIDDKIYNPGDSVLMPSSPHADVVFVAFNGKVTMDLDDAVKFVDLVSPKTVIPYHYDTKSYPVSLDDFKEKMSKWNVVVIDNYKNYELE